MDTRRFAVAAIVRVEEWERDDRLGQLGLSQPLLLEVVDACVAAEANCTANDPPMAKGLMVYCAGVRRLRELFCPRGWERDDTGNFSTIVNHKLRLRLAFMNTDGGTCDPYAQPANRSRKGPNSERAAATNQALLPGIEWPSLRVDGTRPASDDYVTWHMCVHIEGDRVSAELALQSVFEGGYFVDCIERIFLIKDADWAGSGPRPDDDLGPEIEVDVRRK